MRNEFEERVGVVTDELWEVAHHIYQWHPDVPDVGGKDHFARMWQERAGAEYGGFWDYGMLAEANEAAPHRINIRKSDSFTTFEVTDGGMVTNEKGKPLPNIYDHILEELPKHGIEVGAWGVKNCEYFHVAAMCEVTRWPTRYWGIAVYAVTGGSEGHYIHVDIITEGKTTPLFLGKTFMGIDFALELSNALTKILGA